MTFIGNNAGAALAVWQHSETIYLGGNGDFPPDTLASFAYFQFAYGAQIGVDPTIYMFAALGVGEITAALATPSGQASWGDFSPTAMSDSQFVSYTYSENFYGQPQAATIQRAVKPAAMVRKSIFRGSPSPAGFTGTRRLRRD